MKKFPILLLIAFFLSFIFSACARADENKNIRLGVIRFLSRADGVTEKQAEAIGDIFARILANSKALTIVERDRLDEIANEHQLLKEGRFEDDAVIEVGKLMSCQYMLLGAVTNLERKTRETDLWLVSEKKQNVSVTLDIRVVDVTTSKIILSFSESGSASQKGSGFNFYGVQTNDQNFTGIEIPAIVEAVSRACFKIRETYGNEYAHVIDVSSKEITIDAGEDWGITSGALFEIYSDGKEVINLDGVSMGKKRTPLALVKITRVQRDFSVAEVIKNGGRASSVRKGNKIQPISQKEADDLIKQKFFKTSQSSKNEKKKKR
ncbi:MAG: hypothetical protein IJ597_06110 [Synergistaceae bacterium]|nr:hypothetical protein [Synergistaceae bacterium]